MLKHLIASSLSIAVSALCNAQTFYISKDSGYSTLPRYVCHKNSITINVVGYNPFATRLNGKGNDIDLTHPSPPIFGSFTPKISDIAVEDVKASLKEEINKTDTAKLQMTAFLKKKQQIADAKACLESFLQQYTMFIDRLQKLHALSLFENHIKSIIDDPNITKQTAQDNIQALINSVAGHRDPRIMVQSLLDSVKLQRSTMQLCYDLVNETLEPESLTLTGELKDAKKQIALVVKDGSTTIQRKKYFKEEMEYVNQRINHLSIDSVWSGIVYQVAKAMDLKTKILSTPWQHTYIAGQMNEDVKEIELTLTNQAGDKIQEYGKHQFTSYGQLKVDVSAGYLISFKGDQTFSKFSNEEGEVIGVRQQKSDFAVHSIGALVHVYKKRQSATSFGGSAGFSIPVDGRLNFYLGGSAIFTGKARLVITVGASFARMQILDDSNLLDSNNGSEERRFIHKNDTEVKYNHIHRLKPFLGITYNFAQLNAK